MGTVKGWAHLGIRGFRGGNLWTAVKQFWQMLGTYGCDGLFARGNLSNVLSNEAPVCLRIPDKCFPHCYQGENCVFGKVPGGRDLPELAFAVFQCLILGCLVSVLVRKAQVSVVRIMRVNMAVRPGPVTVQVDVRPCMRVEVRYPVETDFHDISFVNDLVSFKFFRDASEFPAKKERLAVYCSAHRGDECFQHVGRSLTGFIILARRRPRVDGNNSNPLCFPFPFRHLGILVIPAILAGLGILAILRAAREKRIKQFKQGSETQIVSGAAIEQMDVFRFFISVMGDLGTIVAGGNVVFPLKRFHPFHVRFPFPYLALGPVQRSL